MDYATKENLYKQLNLNERFALFIKNIRTEDLEDLKLICLTTEQKKLHKLDRSVRGATMMGYIAKELLSQAQSHMWSCFHALEKAAAENGRELSNIFEDSDLQSIMEHDGPSFELYKVAELMIIASKGALALWDAIEKFAQSTWNVSREDLFAMAPGVIDQDLNYFYISLQNEYAGYRPTDEEIDSYGASLDEHWKKLCSHEQSVFEP